MGKNFPDINGINNLLTSGVDLKAIEVDKNDEGIIKKTIVSMFK